MGFSAQSGDVTDPELSEDDFPGADISLPGTL
jgi:hypothetical protein